jgi:microcin C transport system permease protein
MWIYILKRIALMLPTLIGALTITFIVIQFVPGGPIEQIMAEAHTRGGGGAEGGIYKAARDSDARQIAELKKLYGFDKPVHVRYLEMLGNFARFDLGRSFLQNKDVWSLIKEKLPVSISLGIWTFLFSYLISVPLGIAKAVRDGSRMDIGSSAVLIVLHAIPGFLFALLLIVMFAGGSYFKWFPLRGLVSDDWSSLDWVHKVLDYFWHMALPIVALTIGAFTTMTFLTKNSFIEEIHKQYALTARAKGLSEGRVLYRHVFRNAMMIPIAGIPASFVGVLFAGSLIIEVIFSLDGLGLLAFEAALNRDYPVMFGTLYVFGLIGLIMGIIGDLMYAVVDPRLDFEAR